METSDETQEEQERDGWNRFFAELLGRSRTRPSSEAIAKAVRRHLPESESQGRSISKSLVEKWRSKSSKSSRKPTRPKIAQALVVALDELGVFQGDSNAEESRAKLINLLGFDEELELSQYQILKEAWDTILSKLYELPNRGVLSKSELLLAGSCLMSQRMFDHDKQQFLQEARNEGHVVIFPEWDASPTENAQTRRNEIAAELRTLDFTNYLNEQLRMGLNVDLVFGIHDLKDDPSYNKSKCESTIELLKDSLTQEFSEAFTKDRNRPRIRVSRNEEGLLGQTLWLHLYPSEVCQGWKLIRHPDLFNKIKDGRVAIFCSPLREDERKDAFRRLGIRWETVPTPHWEVEPGECIYPKNDLLVNSA